VAFSPDGRLLASGGDKAVRGRVPAIGQWRPLASSGAEDNETVRLWDPATGQQLRTMTGHDGKVFGVAFSPDGRLLASGGGDNTVRLWDPATGEHRGTLAGHDDPVFGVAFSPDGRLLATASYDKTVRLWDLTLATGS
jgi:WD40 repeat protein